MWCLVLVNLHWTFSLFPCDFFAFFVLNSKNKYIEIELAVVKAFLEMLCDAFVF
jgi:hypothetical protein